MPTVTGLWVGRSYASYVWDSRQHRFQQEGTLYAAKALESRLLVIAQFPCSSHPEQTILRIRKVKEPRHRESLSSHCPRSLHTSLPLPIFSAVLPRCIADRRISGMSVLPRWQFLQREGMVAFGQTAKAGAVCLLSIMGKLVVVRSY